MKRYYEAYEARYSQVHAQGLQWSSDAPTPIVEEIIRQYGKEQGQMLEIGCGEGRDAAHLLAQGYDLLATDVSPEAVRYCREKYPQFAQRFCVLDALKDTLAERFDVIYAVAVLHMLTEDTDRAVLYRFIQAHLKADGVALVLSMGDGETQRRTDPARAFNVQERMHAESGKTVHIAATTCRMVTMADMISEAETQGLRVIESGLTNCEPEFDCMQYVLLQR